LGRWHPDTTRRVARNQVFLIAKHYPARLLLRYAWSIFVAQALWGLVALRHGRGWPWLCGKVEGMHRWRELRGPLPDGRGSEMLCEGEREIRRVQRESGRDLYWTLYFLLTAGAASEAK
jgi:hypothetical protein